MKNLIKIKNTKIFGKVYSKFIKHFFGINNYLRNSKTTTRRRHHTTTVIRKSQTATASRPQTVKRLPESEK